MILKQKFQNGSERNVDLGDDYLLIEKHKNLAGFENHIRREFPEALHAQRTEDVQAFIVYNEGKADLKVEACFVQQYNAIMSPNGAIYHVITCMPD